MERVREILAKWVNSHLPFVFIPMTAGAVFSYKLRYIVGFWLVEMAISTNQKPTLYRNLYENTGPVDYICLIFNSYSADIFLYKPWSPLFCSIWNQHIFSLSPFSFIWIPSHGSKGIWMASCTSGLTHIKKQWKYMSLIATTWSIYEFHIKG